MKQLNSKSTSPYATSILCALMVMLRGQHVFSVSDFWYTKNIFEKAWSQVYVQQASKKKSWGLSLIFGWSPDVLSVTALDNVKGSSIKLEMLWVRFVRFNSIIHRTELILRNQLSSFNSKFGRPVGCITVLLLSRAGQGITKGNLQNVLFIMFQFSEERLDGD